MISPASSRWLHVYPSVTSNKDCASSRLLDFSESLNNLYATRRPAPSISQTLVTDDLLLVTQPFRTCIAGAFHTATSQSDAVPIPIPQFHPATEDQHCTKQHQNHDGNGDHSGSSLFVGSALYLAREDADGVHTVWETMMKGSWGGLRTGEQGCSRRSRTASGGKLGLGL